MFVDCDFLNGIYYFDWMNNNLFVELTMFDCDECWQVNTPAIQPVSQPANWMETNNNNNEYLFALETGGVGAPHTESERSTLKWTQTTTIHSDSLLTHTNTYGDTRQSQFVCVCVSVSVCRYAAGILAIVKCTNKFQLLCARCCESRNP